MYPGYWLGLEGFLPVFNAVQSSAIASVAMAPDLWRGTGRATFLLVQPLLLIGLTPEAAVRTVFGLSLVLGGLGIYIWLRSSMDDRAAGLAGLVYMLWPPFLATVYLRGSLSNALLLGLIPLALAGCAIFAENRSPSATGVVVLSILWMWRAQAGLAVFATALLLAYVLIVERSRLAALVVGVSGAAGLVSLIPLWSIRAPSPVHFADHFVYFFQLLYGGWKVAPSVPGWQDEYPFQLGFAALVFSAAAIWLWRTHPVGWRKNHRARLLGFGCWGIAVLVLLSLNVSAPIWQITQMGRLLTYPWQILLLAGPFLALLAGSLPALSPILKTPAYWSVLVVLVVLGSFPYLTTTFTQVKPPNAPVAVFGADDQIVFLKAELRENKQQAETQLAVTWQVLQPLAFDYNVFFQALAPKDKDLQVIAQLDTQPLPDKTRPATTWQAGQVFTTTYHLRLTNDDHPVDFQTPSLRYYFGYYNWQDGKRLPVDGGIDDKLIFYGK